MTPEQFLEALRSWDASAVLAWEFDRGELTLEIAPERIAAVCRHLKDEWKIVR
jgi:hypothetical protein